MHLLAHCAVLWHFQRPQAAHALGDVEGNGGALKVGVAGGSDEEESNILAHLELERRSLSFRLKNVHQLSRLFGSESISNCAQKLLQTCIAETDCDTACLLRTPETTTADVTPYRQP